MATPNRNASLPASTPSIDEILRVWRADRSICMASAQLYLQWITRFRRYWHDQGLVEANELTYSGAERFLAWYGVLRGVDTSRLHSVSSPMHALRRVYEVAGVSVPEWRPAEARRQPTSAILREYAEHLARHRGNPESTVLKKLDHVGKLLAHLADSGKSWRQMRLSQIDAFLIDCAHRYARTTTADIASTIRSFARFLVTSGRLRVDLADAVISPVQPRFERPRRALPWEDVQRLLRAVDTSTAKGLRDHALLLMMSTYGLGAGEVIRLQLDDIDWKAGTLKVTRPKTGVNFVLPLLAPVAKVLAQYLRHGRPRHTPTRHLFVQMKVPFAALTASGAIRHIIVKHANAAGIQAEYLGSHVLRHSNAARQLDVGTPARVLSDLLVQ